MKKVFRLDSNSALLIGATLLISGAFKAAAFAREAFISAKFGLSAVTDAYFGLQQFPLTLVTFMFGAFALAFTPAYANGRRTGMVAWLPGLLFYGCLVGVALTALMLAAAPFLLHALHLTGASEVRSTLAILAACYIPIVCVGIWSGICTARGRNLLALSVGGLPYLIMTLALFALYAFGRLNNLSLPVSMTAGFGLIGLCSLICIVRSQPFPAHVASVTRVWSFPEFRAFFWQLGVSSIENGGYAANQLLMLYFVSQTGTGALSANNCAMRIGLLGFSLLASPLALLVQARL